MNRNIVYACIPSIATLIPVLAPEASGNVILWNNGGLVTNPGAGFNGADVSQASSNFSTLGLGAAGTHKVADDFVVPVGGWNISSITGYAFIAATYTTFPPSSPITGVSFSIYNGTPGAGGIIVATSTTLLSTSWTGFYRTANGSLADNNAPIMAATANFGSLNLSAGTYWASFNFTGSVPGFTTTPSVPPVMNVDTSGNPVTASGNSRFLVIANTWGTEANGTPTQGNEFPFVINGNVVPAPTPLGLLSIGILAAVRRKR